MLHFNFDLIQTHVFQKGHVFGKDAWPSWAYEHAWAPEMHFVNGSYRVYFSMKARATDVWAIGVATSANRSNPFGPYVDSGDPIIEHTNGAIDITWFKDPR